MSHESIVTGSGIAGFIVSLKMWPCFCGHYSNNCCCINYTVTIYITFRGLYFLDVNV